MKIGRNEPCPCGSGKKYKRCCMDTVGKQQAEIADELSQTVAMNPDLSLDELNLVAQHKMAQRNNQPLEDFCGLSPAQMANWLYEPFAGLKGVSINTPADLSQSPVMCYLALILDAMLAEGGSIKTTAKGNLPAKLAKVASGLLPELAVCQHETIPSISEFAGNNEDKFNALHYTRLLADIAGIIYLKKGRFYLTLKSQKIFVEQGINAFYPAMLEAATTKFNWAYFDAWQDDVPLNQFWLFMLWRLQSHGSAEQLIKEVCTAFPDILKQVQATVYASQEDVLGSMIETRFIMRCLQFFGFVLVDPLRFVDGQKIPMQISMQPLLSQTFRFSV